ncbi:MAG: lipocalin-like domain-containing protein [Pseudomonadota bacterium]
MTRHLRNCAILLSAGLSMPITSAVADDVKSQILGQWELYDWTVTDETGTLSHPYGESAKGSLVYTDDGHMAVQLFNPDAPDYDSVSIETRYFAYYGTYTIDEDARTITHSITGSLLPSWIGTNQVRSYEFTNDNHLKLGAIVDSDNAAAAAGAGGTNVLEWARPD